MAISRGNGLARFTRGVTVRVTFTNIMLVVALVLVGTMGVIGMRGGNLAIETLYNDRIVAMRQLKIVADTYAVFINMRLVS